MGARNQSAVLGDDGAARLLGELWRLDGVSDLAALPAVATPEAAAQ